MRKICRYFFGSLKPCQISEVTIIRDTPPPPFLIKTSYFRNWDAPGPKGRFWNNFGFAFITFAYWWMFHGIFTEPEHITGHGDYLDVTKLTDAELGQS